MKFCYYTSGIRYKYGTSVYFTITTVIVITQNLFFSHYKHSNISLSGAELFSTMLESEQKLNSMTNKVGYF